MNTETRSCKNCNTEFALEANDIDFYRSIDVLFPKLCSECRYQRRIANRNEWSLYKRSCDLCRKDIVSIYNPEYPGPVYCQPCFWSDRWDARDYAQEFDFSRSFFEQYKEFRFKVPRLAITNTQSVNSEYTNQSQENKDCYLVVSSNKNEGCLYGNWFQDCKYSVDCYMTEKSELLYESVNCAQCFQCAYLQNCSDCLSSYFLKDCRGCSNCFGCIGLRNKQYCWFNEQLTKEEYEKKLKGFVWTREALAQARAQLRTLELAFPHKYFEGSNNVNSTGDYIENNKNVRVSFNCRHAEDLTYGQDAWWTKNSRDVTEVFCDYSYEIEGAISSRSIALSRSWHVFDSFYSELCFNSDNLFACMSMNKKQYCIFNKQYSKEMYFSLKRRIIEHMKDTGEWGEFFPTEISPFAYNETVAQEYFPLTRVEVMQKGWKWYDRDQRDYQVTLSVTDLPSTIQETQELIPQEIIGCINQNSKETKELYRNCATAFRVTPVELKFYQHIGVPLPDRCFPCRRQDRFALRNPRHLWHRKCQCGGAHSKNEKYMNIEVHYHNDYPDSTEFETSYAPERPEIVYCEQCYQAEVA